MSENTQSAEIATPTGSAHGDDPRYHAIKDGRAVCTAPEDAPCRTSPTCECENWCGCDGSPEDAKDNHDEGDDAWGHCCMQTTKPGQSCWLVPWIEAPGLDESFDHSELSPADYDMVSGEHTFPDGAITCDWEDGVLWRYSPGQTGGDPS